MKRFLRSFAERLQDILLRFITTVSFWSITLIPLFVLYYLFVNFNLMKVVAGCVTLCVMIHLNKSI